MHDLAYLANEARHLFGHRQGQVVSVVLSAISIGLAACFTVVLPSRMRKARPMLAAAIAASLGPIGLLSWNLHLIFRHTESWSEALVSLVRVRLHQRAAGWILDLLTFTTGFVVAYAMNRAMMRRVRLADMAKPFA